MQLYTVEFYSVVQKNEVWRKIDRSTEYCVNEGDPDSSQIVCSFSYADFNFNAYMCYVYKWV